MRLGWLTAFGSLRAAALAAFILTSALPSVAAPCGTGTFEAWLEDFKKEAISKGISPAAIQAGLRELKDGLTENSFRTAAKSTVNFLGRKLAQAGMGALEEGVYEEGTQALGEEAVKALFNQTVGANKTPDHGQFNQSVGSIFNFN